MVRRMIISTPSTGEVYAKLSDENPKTANTVWEALPIKGRANTWGDEIYFAIPVEIKEENARDVVEVGDLGYWPPGNAFCIFFGKTPVSRGDEVRPASPVNVFGQVEGDPKVFKKVKSGEEVKLVKT